MTDKYKIKEKDIGIKDTNDNKKVKIKIKGGEMNINKDAYKEDAEVEVTVDIIEMNNDTEGTKHEGQKVKGKVKRGTLSDSIELSEELMTGIKLKEKLKVAVEG